MGPLEGEAPEGEAARYAHLADTATKKTARQTGLAALETPPVPGPRRSTALPDRSEIALFFPERDTSLELATFGLGSPREREQYHGVTCRYPTSRGRATETRVQLP